MRNGLLLSLAGLTICGLPSALAQTFNPAPPSSTIPVNIAFLTGPELAQAQAQAVAATKPEPPRDVLPAKANYAPYTPYGIPDEDKPKDHAGSAYIPLDSWVYPQLDRLYSMGYLDTMFLGLRPLQPAAASCICSRSRRMSSSKAAMSRPKACWPASSPILATEQPEDKAPRGTVYGVHQVYDRGMYISQQTLRDSYHIGNTIVNDYGRPYQPGFNNLLGGAVLAEKGRFSFYVRAEYQHAPSAAGYTDTLTNLFSNNDQVGPATGFNYNQATIPTRPISPPRIPFASSKAPSPSTC